MELTLTIKVNKKTNEVELISAENTTSVKISNKSTKKSTKKSNKSVSQSDTPEIILEDNRLIFNDAALNMLNVDEGDKIHIKYNQKNGVKTPIIGLNSEFGVKAGNVLNKNKTVSWRGQKNEVLSEFGEVFTLKPFDNKDGSNLFVLVDDNNELSNSDDTDGISVSFDDNIKNINTDQEYDLEMPNDIESDPNSDTVELSDLDSILSDVGDIDLEDLIS